MGNAITLDARALWLFVRNDGGWWSISLLTHHWRPTFADFEVEAHLEALRKGRFLEARLSASGMQYAFTSDCLALPGSGARP